MQCEGTEPLGWVVMMGSEWRAIAVYITHFIEYFIILIPVVYSLYVLLCYLPLLSAHGVLPLSPNSPFPLGWGKE